MDDFEEKRDCLTNILANSILPCFKFASDLNLVHLLVPEISGSFLKTLRLAAESFRGFSGNEIVIHGFPVDSFVDHLAQMIESKVKPTFLNSDLRLGLVLFRLDPSLFTTRSFLS